MELTVPLTIAAFTVALLGLGAIIDDRRVRLRRLEADDEPIEAAIPLLHSINDDRCIGCEACIDVCPTEVLDLIDHKVRVSRFSDCVQCEQCQNACPTMALVMYREGTTPRMLTVPELDDHFQTGVAGQYLIGEVAGKPLVKNAANLGRAVIEHITKELAIQRLGGSDVLDVVIVGSGPGGLSAGLTCIKRKLSCLVLEKEQVISSTVSRYPKGKHFMAEPANSPNISFLPVFDSSKEELVAAWQQVVKGVKLPIKLGESVETVKKGDDGVFEIKTTVATYRARRVVLATGLRGKPRLLAVPGANLEKVESLLDDPGEFAGQDVLVVGGGDSAVEGAMSLADVGARVVLSYRGDGFKRCKQGNQKRLAEMIASGKLDVELESNVKEFTPAEVAIKLKDGTIKTYPNQHAFVLIGADTPVVWLEANNVRFIERPHLYTLGAADEVVRRLVPDATECPKSAAESIALLLGQHQPQAVRPSAGRMRSVIGQMGHEIREAVGDLSGVFRAGDGGLRPQRGRTRADRRKANVGRPEGERRSGRDRRADAAAARNAQALPLIPAQRLARRQPTAPGRAIPSVLGRVQRMTTSANAFAPERTMVGSAPIRPRSNQTPTRGTRRANDTEVEILKRHDDGRATTPVPTLARSFDANEATSVEVHAMLRDTSPHHSRFEPRASPVALHPPRPQTPSRPPPLPPAASRAPTPARPPTPRAATPSRPPAPRAATPSRPPPLPPQRAGATRLPNQSFDAGPTRVVRRPVR